MVVFRTIRSKLIIGIVSLLIIMTLAFTVVATQRTESALRVEIEATHQARAEGIASELDRRMTDALAFAEAAGRNELFRQAVPDDARDENGTVPPDEQQERRVFLEQLVATVDLFGAAILVDEAGDVVLGEPYAAQVATRIEESEGPQPGRLEVLAQLAEGFDEGFVVRGPAPGTWSAVVPLQDQQGVFQGILLFEGRNAPLIAFVEDVVEDNATVLFILDDQHRVIAGPAPYTTGSDLARATAALDRAEGSLIISLEDGRYLASDFQSGATSWRLILATDTDAAFDPVQRILRTTVLLGGLALVFGVVMSLVLAQGITVPLRRLQEASQRVTAGAYGTQVRVSTRDELADLAGAFNAMSSRLQEENQRLMRYQESLEETVEERTAAYREKNDELEAFVYAASHDLRTPIISLDWLLQELEDNLPEDGRSPEVVKTVQRIRANIDGMDRLVSDLLELSRIGRTEGEPEPVVIRQVVEEVLTALSARIEERQATVEVDVPDAAVVVADSRRMHQVLSNLIANALKYGRDEEARVSVRAVPIGDRGRPWKWRIDVADNGPGVPEEQRERIFMLFQTAPDPLGRPIQGTGVGLAMVRKIILAYGGQIHVADAPGGGALFWFTLPAPRRPSGQRPGAPEATATKDRGAERGTE